MSWARGDQAMCVKRITGRTADEEARLERTGRPSPPLVYEVVVARGPSPRMLERWPEYADMIYIGLRPWRGIYWNAAYFRKLDPLPPEEIDLPAWMPAPTPETV